MKHSSAPYLRALVPIAVLAAFAAPATAQLTSSNSRDIHAPILGLPYTQTGCGDFDGDAVPDIAYLRGGNLGVMIAPAIFEVTMNDIALVNDFDVLSTHATTRILTVSDAGGLQEWRMEEAPIYAEPNPNPPTWVWNADSVGPNDWIGATIVRTWPVDAGSTYIVGLDSTGKVLLALQRIETGGPLTWLTSWTVVSSMPLDPEPLTLANPEPVLDIVPFNLNGTGGPEVAVVRANRLQIYRPFDAVQSVSTVQGLNGHSYTAFTRIRHAGRTHEWLGCVLTQNLDGVTQKFMTYGYDLWRNILTIGSTMQVFALSAGRVDADEDDDLVVGYRSQVGVMVISNTGAVGDSPKFVTSNAVTVTATPGAAPNNLARPYIADLDGDGDGDFGFPIRNVDEMWVSWGTAQISATLRPSLVTSTIGSTDVAVDLVDAEDLNRIRFGIEVPAYPSSVPAGPKYLEVKLYSMKYDSTNPPNYAEPTAFSTERMLVPASASTQAPINRDVLGAQSSIMYAPGFDRIVYITAQCLVAADATANPTWAGPCMMAIVQGQDDLYGFGIARPNPFNQNRLYVNAHLDLTFPGPFELGDLSLNAAGQQSVGGSVGNGGYVPCIPIRPERPPRQ